MGFLTRAFKALSILLLTFTLVPYGYGQLVVPAVPSLPGSGALGAKIGVIAAVHGTVELVSRGTNAGRVVGSGEAIFTNDVIKTGPDATLQILLKDQTVFTVGKDSSVRINEFNFDPITNEGTIQAEVIDGVFKFVTGRIAKQNSESMTIKLPSGIMGVRGTIGLVNANRATGSSTSVLLGPGKNTTTNARIGALVLTNDVAGGKTKSVRVDRPGFASEMNPGEAPTLFKMPPNELRILTDAVSGPPARRQGRRGREGHDRRGAQRDGGDDDHDDGDEGDDRGGRRRGDGPRGEDEGDGEPGDQDNRGGPDDHDDGDPVTRDGDPNDPYAQEGDPNDPHSQENDPNDPYAADHGGTDGEGGYGDDGGGKYDADGNYIGDGTYRDGGGNYDDGGGTYDDGGDYGGGDFFGDDGGSYDPWAPTDGGDFADDGYDPNAPFCAACDAVDTEDIISSTDIFEGISSFQDLSTLPTGILNFTGEGNLFNSGTAVGSYKFNFEIDLGARSAGGAGSFLEGTASNVAGGDAFFFDLDQRSFNEADFALFTYTNLDDTGQTGSFGANTPSNTTLNFLDLAIANVSGNAGAAIGSNLEVEDSGSNTANGNDLNGGV